MYIYIYIYIYIYTRRFQAENMASAELQVAMPGHVFEPRCGQVFPHPSRLASLFYNCYGVFPGGKGDGAWHRPPTAILYRGWKRVSLYPCFPTVPSWHVIGWNVLLHARSQKLDFGPRAQDCKRIRPRGNDDKPSFTRLQQVYLQVLCNQLGPHTYPTWRVAGLI